MSSPHLLAVAAVSASALACAAGNLHAPRAASRAGSEPGVRTFLVDDMLFDAPDLPSRIEGHRFILEEDGKCRDKRFMGPVVIMAQKFHPHWQPTNTCTSLEVVHFRGSESSAEACERSIAREVPFGVYRRFSGVERTRESLGGALATRDDLRYLIGSEKMLAVYYSVCRGEDYYGLRISGMDAASEDIERIRARVVASFRWIDPAAAAAAGAAPAAAAKR